jgi:ribosomal protein S18 acetylase RimI-like enzyme
VEKKSFSIRTMEIHDLAEVYELGETVFTADLWQTLYRNWDQYEVATLFTTDGDFCLVAENDDENPSKDQRIVGFVLGTVIEKRSAWNYGYIIWLAAHPEWQGEGIAGKLMDKLVEIMVAKQGVRILMADTDPTNEKAIRFFHKNGFSSEKAHVYLSTNLEHNEKYSHLIKESRENLKAKKSRKKKAQSSSI